MFSIGVLGFTEIDIFMVFVILFLKGVVMKGFDYVFLVLGGFIFRNLGSIFTREDNRR